MRPLYGSQFLIARKFFFFFHSGWARGCDEFDKAFLQAKSIEPINSLVINRAAFLQFFWRGNDDAFSFLHAWRMIDKLWDVFDQMPPRIHGFVTANVSARMLRTRSFFVLVIIFNHPLMDHLLSQIFA